MIEEKILISIEVPKPEGEAEIDKLTRKITDLQIATANLQKQNNELVKQGKQNTDEYIENTRQIEINKQKINEAVASRKGLVSTLAAEENSIKALNVRNAELKKQRDLITTATAEGRAEISRINAEINKNNDIIKENVSAQEKQRLGVGGYLDALDKLVPGLGATATGFLNMAKAALVFIATPIGAVIAALGAALFALTSYFKGSEEGQNRLNKIVAVGSAIFEQFMNVVEDLGEALFDAFTNPKQALIDLGKFLQENIANRLEGVIELIPKLGQAVDLLFKGKFAEAGKVAADAALKVATGVEDATDKLAAFIEETTELVNKGIENGERLAEFQAKIDKDARALVVDREKTALEVAKLRADALKVEGEERKKILQEAIALEEQLAARETALAKTRLANAELLRDANGDDKEALDAVAQARADVFKAEATAFQNTLRFRKEIEAIDEAEIKRKQKISEDEIALAKKTADEIAAAEREQFENNITALESQNEEKLNLLKEAYLNDLISKQEFEDQFSALEFEALLARKDFLIANKMDTAAIESEILDRQVKKKQDTAAQESLIDKKRLDNERAIVFAKIGLLDQLGGVLQQVAGKNKALAIAGVIIQKAAAIAQIIAQTAIANAQAVATFWITGGLPWTAINTAMAALSIGSVVAEATSSISQINSAARGGILSRKGGIARGPSHARGGIPGLVNGIPIEFEGDEAIINKKSTRMFRPLLSQINQAGGGVAFGQGGMTNFATGGISGTQTRLASSQAENSLSVSNAIQKAMNNLPPIIVTVEDINERASEVSEQTNKAIVV